MLIIKVTLILTTTGNGLCNARSDTMDITILPAPIINAGFDQPVCGDADTVQLNGGVTNASGGTWTTSGTGVFSNVNITNPSYHLSPADTTAGTVTLIFTSTGNGTCKAVNDQVVISISDAPQIAAGPDQTICADASGVNLTASVTVASGVLWTSTGSGTFTPDANTMNAIYVPSVADTTSHGVQLTLTTIGTGSCKPVSDAMNISITPAPTIMQIPDHSICADAANIALTGNITVANGGVWTSNGSGTFAPNPSSLLVTYTPSQADKTNGLVTLMLTTTGNGTCNPVSMNTNLIITPAPTVNAGTDIIICSDSTSLPISGIKTISNGVHWTTNGSGSFVPNADSLNALYVPSTNDILNGGANLLITTTGNGACQPVSDNLRINLTPAPTVNAGQDVTICANSTGILLNGSITVATGGVWTSSGSGTFSPDANGISRTYIPSPADIASKSVRLILSTTGNGTCKIKRDTLLLSIDPLPLVNSGGNKLCSDVSGIVLNGTVANASGAIWSSSGSGSFSPGTTTLNSTYLPSAADIKAGNVTLTLISVGNGTCNADTSSLYLVTVDKKPTADAGPDQKICVNSSTTLSAMQIPNISYAWITENNITIGNNYHLNITANTDTSFVLSVTDIKGCFVYDTVSVFVIDTVKFGLAPMYCFNSGLVIDANPLPKSTSGTFEWYRNDSLLVGENNSTIQVHNIGKHTIIYKEGACSYSDSTIVEPLPVLKGIDKYACPGASTLLSTSPVGVTYQWNLNNSPMPPNSSSITVKASSTPWQSTAYVVTVTDKLGCKNNDTVNVIAIAPPNINLSDTSACVGTPVILKAQPTNIDSVQYGLISHYHWSMDSKIMKDTSSTITVNTSGTYSVIFNIDQCYAYDTATVTFHSLPVPNNNSEYVFCSDNNGEVTLNAGPSYTYDWLNISNGTPTSNNTITVNTPGTYYVKLTNQYNCSVVDSIVVVEACAPQLYNSASFTPGIKGGNSSYYIKGMHFANFEIFIYNRWGEIIFHSKDVDVSWDGTYLGEDMPPGVYPYTISYTGDNPLYSQKHEKAGSVTLIR